jgi:hypothetical protein
MEVSLSSQAQSLFLVVANGQAKHERTSAEEEHLFRIIHL